jgi:hypothetical protein
LNCLEHTIDRAFDTSHLSVTCPTCESFERFVNEAVFQQFRAFEESPPSELDWNRLDRMEKLVVAERLVRSTKTLEDFEIVDGETGDDGDARSAETDTTDADEGSPNDGVTAGGETA